MEQVKPICVMYFPNNFSLMGGRMLDPLALMKELNGWRDYDRDPKDPFGGYVWWCFFKDGITAPELQVFHPKDFTESNYQELKELVLNHIQNIDNQTKQ